MGRSGRPGNPARGRPVHRAGLCRRHEGPAEVHGRRRHPPRFCAAAGRSQVTCRQAGLWCGVVLLTSLACNRDSRPVVTGGPARGSGGGVFRTTVVEVLARRSPTRTGSTAGTPAISFSASYRVVRTVCLHSETRYLTTRFGR